MRKFSPSSRHIIMTEIIDKYEILRAAISQANMLRMLLFIFYLKINRQFRNFSHDDVVEFELGDDGVRRETFFNIERHKEMMKQCRISTSCTQYAQKSTMNFSPTLNSGRYHQFKTRCSVRLNTVNHPQLPVLSTSSTRTVAGNK